MKKIDVVSSLIAGELVAWLFIGIFKNLEIKIINVDLLLCVLPLLFPVLSLLGLWISWLIGKKFLFVFQFAKFFLVGTAATLIDIGVMNFLILISGVATGIGFLLFKGTSFIVATCAKYLADKFWAFEKMEKKGITKEFSQFLLVTLSGLAINIGIAFLVVNFIGPQFGLSDKLWANVGGIIAAFGTAAWNFIGYKYIVFKK